MDPKDFDEVLDSSDPDFVGKLATAIGVKEGDSIVIRTPQFDRVDDLTIEWFPTTVEEFKALELTTPENLKKIGCQIWNEEDGKTHWLYPSEWYEHIPDGLGIVCISGSSEAFKSGKTDNDTRFGALAYGFIQPQLKESSDE